MKTNYLLPNRFKCIGWFLLIPGLILGIIYLILTPEIFFFDMKVFALVQNGIFGGADYFVWVKNNILNEMVGILIIIGALFVAFSKEKSEDEYISKIRVESLVWATYINYLILLFAIIFVYDIAFFWVLVFNMFTVLIFFIIKFNWALYKTKKLMRNEE